MCHAHHGLCAVRQYRPNNCFVSTFDLLTGVFAITLTMGLSVAVQAVTVIVALVIAFAFFGFCGSKKK
jgi:hypothetical protein